MARSRKGAVLVSPTMQSTLPRTFAAGGCAALGIPHSEDSWPLDGAAIPTGLVAGANAAGRFFEFQGGGTSVDTAWGVDIVRGSAPFSAFLRAGPDVKKITKRSSESACLIEFSAQSHKVLGTCFVAEGASVLRPFVSLLVSGSHSLEELAYGDLASSIDISTLSEAAREVIRTERVRPFLGS